MDIQLKSVTRYINIWDCGNAKHFHKTYSAANNCKNKSNSKKPVMNYRFKRHIYDYALFTGMEYEELSEKYNISMYQVKNIMRQFSGRHNDLIDKISLLSNKTSNLLLANKYTTIDKIEELVKFYKPNRIKQFGEACYLEVLDWAKQEKILEFI
jgi:hypothetical protein